MATNGRPKVLLVEPDINPATRRFGLPVIANYPPLAQVRLAAQLDAAVAVVDLRLPGEHARLMQRLRSDPPDIVGVSVTFTSNGDEAIAAMAAIREAAPKTTIVLGGTAPSEDPLSFRASQADLICFRRGDASFAGLVAETARDGRVPRSFPGFFHRENGSWVLVPGPEAPSIASLRPNAWHLLPRHYWRHYFQGMRPTGIGQTSEGCPFDCTFCSVWKTHGRRVNLTSLENAKHDFVSMPGSIRGFFFADDIFLQASEAQIRGLYDPLLDWLASDFLPGRGEYWLSVETRTDLYLREEARFRDWIRRGGVKWVFFGIEAVTDAQLDQFSKRNTMQNNSEALRRATEAGARVMAQIVIPCEADEAYFDEIVRFLREHRGAYHTANFTIATPLPGTDLYFESLRGAPELANRERVAHPAFSLFTALTPTALPVPDFYAQVARVYREANQTRFTLSVVEQGLKVLALSPWLIPRLSKIPFALKALRDPATFLDVHRQVQGERLMETPRAAVA